MSCESGADLLLEMAGKWSWQLLAVNLVTRFVNSGTRLFDDAIHAAAEAWLRVRDEQASRKSWEGLT